VDKRNVNPTVILSKAPAESKDL